VQVTFDDGSGGEFDLVVGADGLRSAVRRLAVDDRPPVPVGQHGWRFLAACLCDGGTVTDALASFVARRRPRTNWVRAQTHRRDRTRNLPTAMRNLTLRAFGRRIFRSNYRPMLQPI
jgi:2-polyprenyl-6-methoxyphenol hydroxylase-like FAD-dependent oxidoreductase